MNSEPVQEQRTEAMARSRGAATGSIRVEAVSDLSALQRYAGAWDELAARSVQRIPMISNAWVASHLQFQLEPTSPWVCLCALDGDELVGVLPLVSRPARVLGMVRTMFFPPCSQHTRSVEPVSAENRSKEVMSALLAALPQVAKDWHCAEFTRIPESSPFLHFLTAPNSDFKVIRDFNGNGSYIDLTGTYNDYIQSLSKNFSRNVRRLTNKIALLPDFEMQFLSSDQARDEHLDWFAEVEASGWKGDKGTAILRSPQLMSFYRSLTRRMAAQGWLEWHFLKADGKVLAANLAARMGRSLVLLKIAYHDEYSSFAPGNVLLNRLIERCYESGNTDIIDCLTDLPWNRNWNMKTTSYFDVRIIRSTPVSVLGAYLPQKTREFARNLAPVYSVYRRIKGLISRPAK